MAEVQTQEKDPVLDGLVGLLKEFKTHKKRLALRSASLAELAAKDELIGKALAAAVVELSQELHDTALSFQEDLARICLLAFQEADDDDADEDEDGDEELDSVLLPADAATIRRSLGTLDSMLDGSLGYANLTPDERKTLLAHKRECKNAFELVDAITLIEGDDPADEIANDDEPGDGGDEAEPAPTN